MKSNKVYMNDIPTRGDTKEERELNRLREEFRDGLIGISPLHSTNLEKQQNKVEIILH